MRKILAAIMISFLFLSIFSSISHGNINTTEQNPPDEAYVGKKQLLIESAKITDIGMLAAKEMLARAFTENITEGMVADYAAETMVGSGSSEYIEAFGVIVASGEQSALPHGDSSDDDTNMILPGEVVVVDLGARYRGYCTDQTRTFFMGQPTSEMMEIYNITLEAQEVGMKAVHAGELARDVDKAARDVIKNYGYGDNFTHGLGHGIGLYIHMPPILSPNSDGVLFQSTDMAVSIEPGIYLTGRFGVRIEDDVLVTRTGYQLITNNPKDLEDAIIYPEGYSNITDIKENKVVGDNGGEMDIGLVITGIIVIAILGTIVYFKKLKK
jgi:Xaa-Pro aminopeptidase